MSSPTFLGAYPINSQEQNPHHTERTNLGGKSSGRSTFTTDSTEINYTRVRNPSPLQVTEIATTQLKCTRNVLMVAGPAGAGGAMIVLIQYLDNCGEARQGNRMKGLGVTNTQIPLANYGFSIIPITQDSSPFQRIRNEQTSFRMSQRENRIGIPTVTESRQHSFSPWVLNSIGIALLHRFQCKAEIRTEWMCLVVVLSAFHS